MTGNDKNEPHIILSVMIALTPPVRIDLSEGFRTLFKWKDVPFLSQIVILHIVLKSNQMK